MKIHNLMYALGLCLVLSLSLISALDITLTSPANDYSGYVGNPTVDFKFDVSNETNLTECRLILNAVPVSTINSIALTNNTISYTTEPGTHYWRVDCKDDLNVSTLSDQRTLRVGSPAVVQETVRDGGPANSDWNEILYESDLNVGYTNNLLAGSLKTVKLKNTSYNFITISPYKKNNITINIQSKHPKNLVLLEGKPQVIDLNGYKLSVSLDGLDGKNAIISIKTSNGITQDTTAKITDEVKQDIETPQVKQTEQPKTETIAKKSFWQRLMFWKN